MERMKDVEIIAERLRREPYRLLTNDCIIKSVRFKRECRRLGIPARVILCLGRAQAHIMGKWRTVLVIHAWGEVDGQRVEVSRALGSSGIWGIIPVNIQALLTVRF